MSKQKILIIDDEINVCRGCQRILEDEGYDTVYVLSGREALAKAETENFDAIVTDLKIPDMNGIRIIKKIKESKPKIPIIMITGYASVPTALLAFRHGAVDYIPKPFEPDELINVVKNAIRRAEEKEAGKSSSGSSGS